MYYDCGQTVAAAEDMYLYTERKSCMEHWSRLRLRCTRNLYLACGRP